MPETQRRLIGYVSSDGELLVVHYESDEISSACLSRIRNARQQAVTRWSIRKCPTHVAEWLLTVGTDAPFFGNGHKAWDYVRDTGVNVRKV